MGLAISLVVIVLVARFLLKGFSPHGVLLMGGLLMLILALVAGIGEVPLKRSTGFGPFNWFAYLTQSFSGTLEGVGLMIMAIGGFVAYMEHIGASGALVHLAMKPLVAFKAKPQLAAAIFIPIGQMLFVCIPSAAGLSLLLMASVFPVLVNLGISRLSAAAVVTSCTAFGVGPASAVAVSAAKNAGIDAMTYFVEHQLPILLPISLLTALVYWIVNTKADKKQGAVALEPKENVSSRNVAPAYYAILPILPLVLLVVFSDLFSFFPEPIVLDTTTAMFISFFVALLVEGVRIRDSKKLLQAFGVFFGGMASMFKSVVTLIVAADIFAQGLISLGFLESLVGVSQQLGFGALGIGVVLVLLIFFASILMGSGNAAFFAFGPLVPGIAKQFALAPVKLILPMNFSASIGRTASPVSGVLLAVADLAKVNAFDLAKRNLLPMSIALLAMYLLHHFN